MSNFQYKYEQYFPIMVGAINARRPQYGEQFSSRYYNYIRGNAGATQLVQGVEDRLYRMNVDPNRMSQRDVSDACDLLLRDSFESFRNGVSRQQPQRSGGWDSGGQVGFSGDLNAGSSGMVGGFGDNPNPLDPDLAIPGNTAPQSAPRQQPAPYVAQSSEPAHSSVNSPFMSVTAEDLNNTSNVAYDLEIFDRSQVANSNFNTVSAAVGICFGNNPQISLLKVESSMPISDPNKFDLGLRKTFTSDLIGMYWGISVKFPRLYTLPIALDEYLKLRDAIAARVDEEGYTPALIIDVLKSCSQATYEVVSTYLVREFNRLSKRFIRTIDKMDQSITLSSLDGIPAFMADPPKSKLTENPASITQFAQITNTFFRSLFSRDNAYCNADELTEDTYPAYLHNDAIPDWDSKTHMSKYGIALRGDDVKRDWLKRVNSRATILMQEEHAFFTNIMSPGFISAVGVDKVVDPRMNGEARALHSILRMNSYKTTDRVAGVVVTPLTRHGTSLLGNYTVVNPLEKQDDIRLDRVETL